jgi:tetratricopeptide (TPR) repeat protein
MEGQFNEGRRLLRDAESQLEALGWRMRLAWLAFFSGPLELAAGDPAAAEVALRRSCRMLQEMGETGWLSSLANYLAEALYQQDRLEEAELWVEESRVAASTDDRASQCWWRAVEAKVLARRKCVEEGEQLARQSVIIADETDQTNDRAFCRSALAEVLEAAGKPEEAVAELQAALALYEQKENVVGAAKTRSLLQRLST